MSKQIEPPECPRCQCSLLPGYIETRRRRDGVMVRIFVCDCCSKSFEVLVEPPINNTART